MGSGEYMERTYHPENFKRHHNLEDEGLMDILGSHHFQQMNLMGDLIRHSHCEHDWDFGYDDGHRFQRCVKCGAEAKNTKLMGQSR